MDEKSEKILKVAEEMFARFGIKKTTMDEIAQKARMGKSTLYYYFKSKEDIFAEVIYKDSQLYKQKLTDAVAAGKTPQEKIEKYVFTRMKHLKELSNYYTTLTDEYLEQYAFVEKVRKDFNQYETSTLSKILTEGVNKGVFSLDDVEITSRNLAIVLKGLEHPLLINNIDHNIETESSQMLKILFRGIETR